MTQCIPLTKGQVALIDDADFPLLNQWKWHYTHKGYAARTITVDKKRTTIFMHRLLMNAEPGQYVDHRDGNRLNNVRANLRFATRSQNQWNRKLQKNASSGFKGVSRHHDKWLARIRVNSKRIYLGYFETAREAAAIYDAAAKRFFGTFANMNRPNDWSIPVHLDAQLSQILEGNRPKPPRKSSPQHMPIPKARSAYHGVYWERGRWRASIMEGRKKIHIGYYWQEEEAAKAYDRTAQILRGDAAQLNFPNPA